MGRSAIVVERAASVNPTADIRFGSRVQASVGELIGTNHDNTQWIGNVETDSGAQYAFAHLDQNTTAVTLRGSYAASPTLSVEMNVAPFASDGEYHDVRALSARPQCRWLGRRFVGRRR